MLPVLHLCCEDKFVYRTLHAHLYITLTPVELFEDQRRERVLDSTGIPLKDVWP